MGQDGFTWFIGVVEDRQDPKKAGRVRVRCLGYHSAKTEDIPTEDLPWASIMMPVTAGGNSGIGTSSHFLLEGTWVVGFFRDPAKQEPVIMGALPGMNTVETTDFTIASSSEIGGFSKGEGFKDPNAFFTDPAQYQAPPQEPPQPTPEEQYIQIQAQKAQADAQNDMGKLELEREKMLRLDDREKDRIESQAELSIMDMQAKYNTQMDGSKLKAMMERDREEMRQNTALLQAKFAQQQQAPPQQTLPNA